jgi:hypothetical protein
MGIRKDYLLREAGLVLAQAKALYLYDAIIVRKLLPYTWIRMSTDVNPAELDAVGVGVKQIDADTFDFTMHQADDLYTCEDVVGQWRSEALERIEAKQATMSELANRSGMSRQTMYRIVKGKTAGLQYLFTLRGRNPTVLWEGKPMGIEYRKIQRDLEIHDLMEPLYASA